MKDVRECHKRGGFFCHSVYMPSYFFSLVGNLTWVSPQSRVRVRKGAIRKI